MVSKMLIKLKLTFLLYNESVISSKVGNANVTNISNFN